MVEQISLVWHQLLLQSGESARWIGLILPVIVVGMIATLSHRKRSSAQGRAANPKSEECASDSAETFALEAAAIGSKWSSKNAAAEEKHGRLMAAASAELAEARRLVELSGVAGAATDLLRIMWHWSWWAEQPAAPRLPVRNITGSEVYDPCAGVAKRKRIDWDFAERRFTMILDQKPSCGDQEIGELSLLVNAELKLRLDVVAHADKPFSGWSYNGVSLCKSESWAPALVDCAGAVRFAEANSRRAYEKVLFAEKAELIDVRHLSDCLDTANARSAQADVDPDSPGQSARRKQKSRGTAVRPAMPAQLRPYGSYPGVQLTYAAPEPMMRKPAAKRTAPPVISLG